MGAKQINLIGIKFNRLSVIKFNGSRMYGNTYKRMWECKCDCGKIVIVNTSALTTNNTKSCGCLHNELSSMNSKKSRYKIAKKDAGYNSVYSTYRSNAFHRNLEFNIDIKYFISLLEDKCFYCNCEPSNIYLKRYYNVKYNGIDRIDNNKGYTKDNTVSCCKICNISKNNYTTDVFLNWIFNISKNYENLKLKLNDKAMQ